MKEIYLNRTLRRGAFAYVNNFVKKKQKQKKQILLYRVSYTKFQQLKQKFLVVGLPRTLRTYKMEFFVTLVIGWKFAEKCSFFRTYFKQDNYDETNENSGNYCK